MVILSDWNQEIEAYRIPLKLIEDIRENKLTTLCREDMQHCNQLWRDYERK